MFLQAKIFKRHVFKEIFKTCKNSCDNCKCKSTFVLDNTLKGIRGRRLDNRQVLRAPGPTEVSLLSSSSGTITKRQSKALYIYRNKKVLRGD